MKKYIWSVIVILLIVGALVWSSGNRLAQEIVIGAPLPLSGASASIGERVKAGMTVAQAEVNQEYPFKIKLIYEDDRGEAPQAVTVVRKLIDVDHTKVLIGLLKSDPLLAVAPITEEHKVILFSPTAGAEKISQAGDYVFRNLEKPIAHGEGVTRFLQGQGVTSAALFIAQASNAQSYGQFFKTAFEGAGGRVVFETSYNPNTTDFRTDIAKAKVAKPDAVYLAVATAKDAGVLTRQLREQGFVGVIAASVAADAKEFFDAAGKYAEGVFITAAFFDKDDPKNATYASEYKKLTGADSDGFAANGYDAVKIIAKALDGCGGDQDTDCIRDYLYSLKDFSGAGGLTTFDKNGDVIKPVMIKVARNGKFVKF